MLKSWRRFLVGNDDADVVSINYLGVGRQLQVSGDAQCRRRSAIVLGFSDSAFEITRRKMFEVKAALFECSSLHFCDVLAPTRSAETEQVSKDPARSSLMLTGAV